MTIEEMHAYKKDVLKTCDTDTLNKYLASAKEKLNEAISEDNYYRENPKAPNYEDQPDWERDRIAARNDVSFYTEAIADIEALLYVRGGKDYQEINSLLDELEKDIQAYKNRVGDKGLNKQTSLFENGVDDPDYSEYLENIATRNAYLNKLNMLNSNIEDENKKRL